MWRCCANDNPREQRAHRVVYPGSVKCDLFLQQQVAFQRSDWCVRRELSPQRTFRKRDALILPGMNESLLSLVVFHDRRCAHLIWYIHSSLKSGSWELSHPITVISSSFLRLTFMSFGRPPTFSFTRRPLTYDSNSPEHRSDVSSQLFYDCAALIKLCCSIRALPLVCSDFAYFLDQAFHASSF